MSSRATCLVYYASAYGPWLLLVVVLHWAVVFLWLVCPGVSPPPSSPATKGGALRATWLAAALAFLHLIAYANLDDNSSRLKAVMFYIVMGIENVVLLVSWYLTVKPNYIPLIPLGAVLSYILGLFFMVLYYRFFHVRRLKYEAGGRMSTPENCPEECGSEPPGNTPATRATSTPVKEELTPPQLPLKHHTTRYRYYGNGHRHGGIPGVFNCRFTNPYTAAMTKRKKKKPTSFVPPPSVLPSNHCPLPFWCRPLVSDDKNSSPLSRLDEKKRQQLAEMDGWQCYPQQLAPAYLREVTDVGGTVTLPRERAKKGRPRYYPPPNSSDGDVDSGQEDEDVCVPSIRQVRPPQPQPRVTRL